MTGAARLQPQSEYTDGPRKNRAEAIGAKKLYTFPHDTRQFGAEYAGNISATNIRSASSHLLRKPLF
jgi:hypothetical protein